MDASPSFEGPEARPVVLLGLGFTTRRLARRLLLRRTPVYAVVRDPARYSDLVSVGLMLKEIPPGSVLINTVPPLSDTENSALHSHLIALRPSRVIYISSTGVYGRNTEVDAQTPADPATPKARMRLAEEDWIRAGTWKSLIVRPAAIYGPGRGVHIRIARGEPPRVTGPGAISRIHADDLAAVLEAGVRSDLEGTWPLADDLPCSSDEINEFCSRLLRVPLVSATDGPGEPAPVPEGRRVDGSEIRRLLGVSLAYPDYRAGILAAVMKLT